MTASKPVYSPLDRSKREIRLLEITESTTVSISCRLHTATLSDTLRFAALSYLWGDPSVRIPILVDGRVLARDDDPGRRAPPCQTALAECLSGCRSRGISTVGRRYLH